MAVISKGTTLSVNTQNSFSDSNVLANLQDWPDLLGSPSPIDVTCLSDAARVYVSGINDLSGSLIFTFLWDKAAYKAVHDLEDGIERYWQIKFADNVTVTFKGTVTTTIMGKSVNEALQFQANICPTSEMTVGGLTSEGGPTGPTGTP